jgi:hypothetical protein
VSGSGSVGPVDGEAGSSAGGGGEGPDDDAGAAADLVFQAVDALSQQVLNAMSRDQAIEAGAYTRSLLSST